MRFQAGIEQLAIIGALLAVILPLTLYTTQTVSSQTRVEQAESAAQEIADAINTVGSQGYPAKKTISVVFPSNIGDDSRVTNDSVILKLGERGTERDIVAAHEQCASGILPEKAGRYRITVFVLQDGCVEVSTDLIVVSPASITETLESGESVLKIISFTNYGQPLNLNLSMTGENTPYVDLDTSTGGIQSQADFFLEDEEEWTIRITGPSSSGTYEGVLQLRAEGFSRDIPVTIIVPAPLQLTVSTFEDDEYSTPSVLFSETETVFIQVDCSTQTGNFTVNISGSGANYNIGTGSCPQERFEHNTTGDSLGNWTITATSGSETDIQEYKLVSQAVQEIDLGATMYERADRIYFTIYDQEREGVVAEDLCNVTCEFEGEEYSPVVYMGSDDWKYVQRGCYGADACRPEECPLCCGLHDWYTYDFNDSGWASTSLPHTKHIWTTPDTTRLYRKHFTINNVEEISSFRVKYQCDEGCVCYVNGHKIAPSSTCQTDYPPNVKIWETTQTDYLNEGDNVIACRVVERRWDQTEFRYFDVGLEINTQELPVLECREECHAERHECESECWGGPDEEQCINDCGTHESECREECGGTDSCGEICHDSRHDCDYSCISSFYDCTQSCGDEACLQDCLTIKNECLNSCSDDENSCRSDCGITGDCDYFCHNHRHDCESDCFDQKKECEWVNGTCECEHCEKIYSLTIKYLGSEDSDIVSSYATQGFHNDFIKNYTLNEDNIFVATDVHPALGGAAEVTFEIEEDTGTFHTSCSQPIGPGSQSGDFLIIDWDATCCEEWEDGECEDADECHYCDECDWGGCWGGCGGHKCWGYEYCCTCSSIDSLTLEYTGFSKGTNVVETYDTHGSFLTNYTLDEMNQFIITEPAVPRIKFKIGEYYRWIHTSCSQPIGPGMSFGYFRVVDMEADNFRPECIPTTGCYSQCDYFFDECNTDCSTEEYYCRSSCECVPDCIEVKIEDEDSGLLYKLEEGSISPNNIDGELVSLSNGTYYFEYNDTLNLLDEANSFSMSIIDPWCCENAPKQSKIFEIAPGAPNMPIRMLVKEPLKPNIREDEDLTIRVEVYDQNKELVTSSTPYIRVKSSSGGMVDSGVMQPDEGGFIYELGHEFIQTDITYYIYCILNVTSPPEYQELQLFASRSFNGVLGS